MSSKIISAYIDHAREPAKVVVTYEDGSKESLISYYTDELVFSSAEFKGLTREQALDLHMRRDTAYLRS